MVKDLRSALRPPSRAEVVFLAHVPSLMITVCKAWEVIVIRRALRFPERAGPLAAHPRLVAGNMQTAAALFLQKNATAGPRSGAIRCDPRLIGFRRQEISRCGFTDGDQVIPLVREHIGAVLTTRI